MKTTTWLTGTAVILISIGIGIIIGMRLNSPVASVPTQKPISATPNNNSDLVVPPPIPATNSEDSLAPYPEGSMGFAISYPQCPQSYPTSTYEYAILGVTDGRSFTHNPCLKDEISWAQDAPYHPSFYINLSFPIDIYPTLTKSFDCGVGDQKCIAYHFGYATAQDAYNYALSQGLADVPWWLDMQTISTWSADKSVNAQVVQGAADFYKSKRLPVGLSTTPYQWDQIAGDYITDLPTWVPGRVDKQTATQYCLNGKGYSGGQVQQVAYVESNFEVVYACAKSN